MDIIITLRTIDRCRRQLPILRERRDNQAIRACEHSLYDALKKAEWVFKRIRLPIQAEYLQRHYIKGESDLGLAVAMRREPWQIKRIAKAAIRSAEIAAKKWHDR